MEKLNPDTNGNHSFRSNIRNVFRRILNKGKPELKVIEKKEPKPSTPQPKEQPPKAIVKESSIPSVPQQKPVIKAQEIVQPKKGAQTDGPVLKTKPKKIENLDRLDEAELYERMTGEKPSTEDLARIRQASKEKEVGAVKPKNKGEILKEYPEVPQEELDLHGKTALEAEREVRLFVLRAKRQSMRLIRIITGKGLHSQEGQSVLKEVAEKKAVELKREGVVFSHKWEKNGGSMLIYLS